MRIRCSGHFSTRSSPAMRREDHELLRRPPHVPPPEFPRRLDRREILRYERRLGHDRSASAIAPLVDPVNSLDLSDGIQLSLDSGTNSPSLLGAFPPLRLARGCAAGSWLLLTPSGAILRNTCTGSWRPIWRVEHHPEGLKGAVALATSVDRLAIVTPEGVQIWTIAGETQVADIPLKGATAVAFSPCGSLLVATAVGGGRQHPAPALRAHRKPAGSRSFRFQDPRANPGVGRDSDRQNG